ncbi:protein QUIRKY-like [Momordica charantia]|uniref:Protein QUIRKY-like n=1 Tax=Momordica charantia TaxID=3673 RepID=A0A6J1DPN1_MOMCH|nr:protein QUIRKY-like [Momordica charantia]
MATAGHVKKLIVEVVDARNLLPKDGHGTSSPYVIVDYHGQRKRTQTAVRDLNPTWNEVLEFNVGPPSSVFGDVLELDVNHDRSYGQTRRSNFLGRIRLSSTQFVRRGEEALIYFHLEKKSLFSWVQGEIGLRIYYSDGVAPPPSPPPPAVATVDGVEEPSPTTESEPPQLPLASKETEELAPVEQQAAEPTVEIRATEITPPVETVVETPTTEITPPVEPAVETPAADNSPPAAETQPLEPHPPPESNVGAEEAPPETSSEDDHFQTMTSLESNSEPEVNFAPQPIRRSVPATARQLWKPPVGSIQVGVIGCKNLVPMKSTAGGKASTDAYCVAKYGSKWVRTRTVCNSFDPKWNEQYTWKVYDPCTVLTIGVFDSSGEFKTDGPAEPDRPDSRIGKVRIRISTLKTGKVYRNFFPLLIFSAAGARKMGEVELAVRFIRTALVTWRDPRATGIFTAFCFAVAVVLYVVPSKMVAVAFGFYYLRHPVFRDWLPSPALNFLRRLPSMSDRLM